MPESIIKMTGGVIRQQKNTILKEVNIEIQSGEFVYLIGKVGSGKSSFLKTLYAELPLEYGHAEVAGFQLKKIRKSRIPLLRRKCGIVFQDFKLLTDRNVYHNLEFVLRATGWKNKKAVRERIETVLEKVSMADKAQKMPHQLSGGEQQRIVLARALLNAPPLILADEPTGNIDPETSYQLVELLKEICATGKTVIIATHQYDLIEKYPGRVFCCENGTLSEKTMPHIYPAGTAATASFFPTAPAEWHPSTAYAAGSIFSVPPEKGESQPPLEKTPEAVPPAFPLTEASWRTTAPEPQTEKSGATESKEEDLLALIGKLDYPEISAFDYELEHLPPIQPEKEKGREEEQSLRPLLSAESAGKAQDSPSSPATGLTPEEEKPKEKPIPPPFDLELIE